MPPDNLGKYIFTLGYAVVEIYLINSYSVCSIN